MKKIILALAALLISTSAWALVPNATPLYNQYNCNSSTTQFPYSFQIAATSDMLVYVTDSSGTITTASPSTYSVNTTNVWVNYPLIGSPCSTGSTITLRSLTPQTQTLVLTARSPFTATAIGAALDKLTIIAQQLQAQINLSFQQPPNTTTTAAFPGSSPGYFIGWNNSGVLSNISNPSLVAQWTPSGANISYNTGNVSTTNTFTAGSVISTGNVGVGSATPGQALDVNGTVRASTFSANNGFAGTPITSGTAGTSILAATDGFVIAKCSFATGATALSLLTDSGNPPVTTINVVQTTDVSGLVSVSGFIKKGNYYKVTQLNGTLFSMNFTPLGS